jgi:ATP-binding cassette subfamily B protein
MTAHTSPAATVFKILRQMSPVRRRQFIGLVALMVVGGLAEIVAIASVLPFIALVAGQQLPPELGWISSLFHLGDHTSREKQIWTAAGLFVGFACFAGAIRLLLAWRTQRFVFRFGHDLAVEVQRRILLQPYSFHIDRSSSQVLAATEKVDLLAVGILLQLMTGISSVLIALFIIAMLMRIDVVTALVAAAGFGSLYLLVTLLTARRLERNSGVAATAHDMRFKTVQESLGGIRDVIIDSSQDMFLAAYRRVDRQFSDARASTLFIGSAPRSIIESGALVLVAALAMLLWYREGSLGPALPILGAMAIGAFRLLPVLQQLFYSWTIIAGNRTAAEQVLEFLELPAEQKTSSEAIEPLPFHDAIRFEEVGFRYSGAREPVIRDASLAIPAGSRVALVGKTGAGKTTFADLLVGLLSPTQGRITVDAEPIANGAERRWQRNISHVPQSIFLADADIARNIAFTTAEEAIDQDRIAEAVRIAQLESFIAGLPNGLATKVGERGIRLSGGQRQRLGIARAIYKGASVLVLDEGTNALDAETEAAIMSALFEDAGTKRTVIVISHRSSAIAGCDLIVRVEAGRVEAHPPLSAVDERSIGAPTSG